MKKDVEVVCAFLNGETVSRGRLQSEVRRGRPTTDPRTDEPVDGLSTVLLWCDDQPVAALVGSVVLLNRAARKADHRKLVAEEAARRGCEVQPVREPDLWRLTS